MLFRSAKWADACETSDARNAVASSDRFPNSGKVKLVAEAAADAGARPCPDGDCATASGFGTGAAAWLTTLLFTPRGAGDGVASCGSGLDRWFICEGGE